MHAGCTLTQVYNLSIDAMGGGATSNGRRNQLPVPWGKAVGILDNFLFGPFLLRIYCSNLATEWENSFKNHGQKTFYRKPKLLLGLFFRGTTSSKFSVFVLEFFVHLT